MRACPQGQHARRALVAHLQAFGGEPALVVTDIAADLVEGELPAFVAQGRAGQHHVAVDVVRWRFVMVERQQHVELRMRRPGHAQAVHARAVGFLQRAGAQQAEEVPGIACRRGIDGQLGAPEAGDAGLERRDRHACNPAASRHGETVGLEADVGFHVFGSGPVRLELQRTVAHLRVDPEHTGAMPTGLGAERPIIEIAGDHRMDVVQAAAFQRRVQPLHGRLRHEVMHPEAVRQRDLRGAQVSRQVQPRTRTIVREPQSATHLHLQVRIDQRQPGGAHAPALAIAPGHGLAVGIELVDHAEAGRPVECEGGLRVKAQAHAVGIALQPPIHAAHARCIADRREMQAADACACRDRTTAHAMNVDVFQHRAGGRRLQPAAHPRR